jgi:hypothetical protein
MSPDGKISVHGKMYLDGKMFVEGRNTNLTLTEYDER